MFFTCFLNKALLEGVLSSHSQFSSTSFQQVAHLSHSHFCKFPSQVSRISKSSNDQRCPKPDSRKNTGTISTKYEVCRRLEMRHSPREDSPCSKSFRLEFGTHQRQSQSSILCLLQTLLENISLIWLGHLWLIIAFSEYGCRSRCYEAG